MTGRLFRAAALPVLALALVAGVLGVQLANGGGEFEPLKPADACTTRTATSMGDGIEGLAEDLVLLGINNAACELGTSREALTLEIAGDGERSDAEIDALRAGLLDAVQQLKDDDELPPASDLVDEALDASDLNSLVKGAIRALPDGVIDSTLKTDDVLTHAIEDLDLRELLDNLDDEGDLNKQIKDAVTQAVKDALVDRLRDLV